MRRSATGNDLRLQEANEVTQVAVVMACYNRRETTLQSIRSLMAQGGDKIQLRVYLTDDASTDGTMTAVKQEFPSVNILHGSGQLFWGGGMRTAISAAESNPYDFLLWLNDDVVLKPNALAFLTGIGLLKCRSRNPDAAIIVGTVVDPSDGHVTYGGFNRKYSWHPASLVRTPASDMDLTPCDTFNGNCVLIPKAVVDRIGSIDRFFIHQIGDIDYGYRARRAGINIFATSTPVGTCRSNAHPGPGYVKPSRIKQLLFLFSPKAMPLIPWLVFMWRYGGVLGVVLLLNIYLKKIIFILFPVRR